MKYFDAHGLFADDADGEDDGSGDDGSGVEQSGDVGGGGGDCCDPGVPPVVPVPPMGCGDNCGSDPTPPPVTPVNLGCGDDCGPGDPGYGDPGYGDPGYGDPGYGDPGYGDPGYGDPTFGNPGGGYNPCFLSCFYPGPMPDPPPPVSLPIGAVVASEAVKAKGSDRWDISIIFSITVSSGESERTSVMFLFSTCYLMQE